MAVGAGELEVVENEDEEHLGPDPLLQALRWLRRVICCGARVCGGGEDGNGARKVREEHGDGGEKADPETQAEAAGPAMALPMRIYAAAGSGDEAAVSPWLAGGGHVDATIEHTLPDGMVVATDRLMELLKPLDPLVLKWGH